ncbi:MAG: tyrosine--tRNA ligase, partial [SAR324 cluster bacterium]|nr:tyrosine--tRNA ligase [SAR324 cluster bacterium]
MSVWEVFRQRGFFQQATDMEALEARSGEGPITGYIGFDPTADSFHAGHLIPLMALLHFQREGHRPIALLGGGTAMIGDPTGKNEMRKMLSVEELDGNIAALRKQLGRLLDFEQGAVLVDNAEWLHGLHYIDFLREVGPHFSVNRMLTFETFKMRLDGPGLSFIEFNYPLLQSYDFLELQRRYGCILQMGGDDQWANIISGVDLVRRMDRKTVFGLTFPLLTLASGAKMGKTEAGAVWLDAEKTSPYQYYQHWVNIGDADVEKCLKLFTLLPLEEIARLAALQGAELREAKAVLAHEATRLIHGEAEAHKARAGAQAVFGIAGAPGGQGGAMDDVPTTKLAQGRLEGGLLLTEILTEVGLAKSKSEVRRLIQQGGVSVNAVRVEDQAF